MSNTAEARVQVPGPESADTAAPVAREPVKVPPEASLVPEAPHLPPAPPKHDAAAPLSTVANDPTEVAVDPEAKTIEQHLAHYLAAHLSPELAKGLILSVMVADSNAITGGAGFKERKDLHMLIVGPAFATPESAQKVKAEIEKALAAHPAFASHPVKGHEKQEPHQLEIDKFGLSPAQFSQLLGEQPKVAAASPAPALHDADAAKKENPAEAPAPAHPAVPQLETAAHGAACACNSCAVPPTTISGPVQTALTQPLAAGTQR